MSEYEIEVIDLLASEYGWSIEYIQSLGTEEINSLTKQIRLRRLEHFKMLSLIMVAAVAGKTLDMLLKKVEKSNKPKEEQRQTADMIRLFNLLGAKPNQLKEGLEKGRMRI